MVAPAKVWFTYIISEWSQEGFWVVSTSSLLQTGPHSLHFYNNLSIFMTIPYNNSGYFGRQKREWVKTISAHLEQKANWYNAAFQSTPVEVKITNSADKLKQLVLFLLEKLKDLFPLEQTVQVSSHAHTSLVMPTCPSVHLGGHLMFKWEIQQHMELCFC